MTRGGFDHFVYGKAVRDSALSGPQKGILWALLFYADGSTGAIPARYSPGLATLAKAAGIGKSTLARHLDALDNAGWLSRGRVDRATAAATHERTKYVLLPPGKACPTAGQAQSGESDTAQGSVSRSGTGPVPERDTLDSVSVSQSGTQPEQPQLSKTRAPLGAPSRGERATTRVLIGEWITDCDVRPDDDTIGLVGRQVAELLRDGIAADDIRRALGQMQAKGLHPSLLDSEVNAVMNRTRRTADDPWNVA